MVYKIDGNIKKTDSATPFDFTWTPSAIGTHTFVATPWSSTGGTGSSGASITVSYNVVAASPTPTPTSTPALSGLTYNGGIPFVNGTNLISGRSYTITAQANARTQSVVYKIDGNIKKTDSATPFDFTWTPSAIGTHTFVATPWSSTGGAGSRGASITVSYNVVAVSPTPTPTSTPALSGLTYNGGTPFVNGTNLISGRSYTITAQANATTQSVVFKIDGNIVKTDSATPFDFTWTPSAIGTHTFVATPWSSTGGTGSSGASITVSYNVVAASPTPTPTPTSTPALSGLTYNGGTPFVNGTNLISGRSYTITAQANATTQSVVFKKDGNIVKTDSATPFDFTWTPSVIGTHTFVATPWSSTGGTGSSGASITVSYNVVAASPTPTPTPTSTPALSGLTYNGGTPFVNGTNLISGRSYTITAQANATTQSVVFKIDGNIVKTDSATPFDFTWTPSVIGTHTFVATPWSSTGGTGSSGASITVSYNVVAASPTPTPTPTSTPALSGLTYNGGTPFVNGTNLISGRSYTITAQANATTQSVVFKKDGTIVKTDSATPFDFTWTPSVIGTHTFVATPWSSTGGTGSSGASITVSFNVVAASPTPTPTPTSTPALSGLTYNGGTPFVNGTNLISGRSYTITAQANATTQSVVFNKDGTIVKTDSATPFDYAYTPSVIGTHTFVATPWSSTGGTGSSGASITVSYNVVAASPTPTPTPTSTPALSGLTYNGGTPFVNGTNLISGTKLYDNGTGKRHHAKRGIQQRRRHGKDRFCDSL